jgi:membrane-anchored mycosin MYCP
MRVLVTRRTTIAAAAALVAVSLPAASPATAEDTQSFVCPTTADDQVVQSPVASVPRKYLDLDRADEILSRRGITPGQGVKVAVLDSGVVSKDLYSPIDVVAPVTFSPGAIEDGHGTALAGLIAAKPQPSDDGPIPVGIAPGAQIVDLKVYSDTPEDSTHGGIDPADVAAALRWLVQHAGAERIKIAVLAMNLPPDPRVQAAVDALAKKNIVLLASTGNRVQPTSDTGTDRMDAYATAKPGEDVAKVVFPAGYTKQVVGVTATADGVQGEGVPVDASGQVLFSSAIDLAMPTFGATTVSLNGSTCVLQTVETSWAVAEAAGVLALLMSAYPDESAAAVEARMLRTADGRVSEIGTNRLYGAGVPQPVDALTRVLTPKDDGAMATPAFRPREYPAADAPPPVRDPLGDLMDHSLWWAILGGAALVITVLLRPLLSRRRS